MTTATTFRPVVTCVWLMLVDDECDLIAYSEREARDHARDMRKDGYTVRALWCETAQVADDLEQAIKYSDKSQASIIRHAKALGTVKTSSI
jgi:hypothetical protein